MPSTRYPPGPPNWVPFRLITRFARDPIGLATEIARTYGDVAHVQSFGRHLVLLNHPDLVQEVLVTHNRNFTKAASQVVRVLGPGLFGSEGESHLRQRRTLQPLFLRDRLAHFAPAVVDFTERRAADWHDGATVKLYDEMVELMEVIVGKTLFDADFGADARRLSSLVAQATSSGFLVHWLPLGHYLEKLPLPSVRRSQQALAALHAFVQGVIDEHRRTGKDRGDILSMMLRLRDEGGPQDLLTDDMIRSQVLTLFVGGHETLATSLTWAWYLLARHPEAEAKLHAEVDHVLAGRLPTAADVPQLPYTEMVFAEAMRLGPPVYMMARRSIREHALAGYTFPVGTLFIMSQYVIQRDPRWYPNPERFEPERMSHEARSKLPRFAYFPFGGGPRQCIGEALGWLEGVLMLATLARQWRFRCTSDRPPPVRTAPTYQPADGLPMTLERRRSQP